MAVVTESVDVAVPIRTAYDHWNQVEDFPEFLEEVREVRKVADRLMRWTVTVGTVTREVDIVIAEQTPDERICWAVNGKAPRAATVTFHRLDPDHTRVSARIEVDRKLEVILKTLPGGDGVSTDRVKHLLNRFRDFIEGRGSTAKR
jgi:uncharacterized membrane protein